jgi:hypothetical protein
MADTEPETNLLDAINRSTLLTSSSPITHADIHDAVQALRWFNPRVKGVLALGDKLEQLSDLLNDENRIQGRVDKLRVQAAAVQTVVDGADAAQRRLDDINAELARHEAAMKAAHEQTVNTASTQAEEILARARREADQCKADALAAAEAESKARAEADAGAIAAREARLAELGAEIETKQAKVDELNTALAALRAKL